MRLHGSHCRITIPWYLLSEYNALRHSAYCYIYTLVIILMNPLLLHRLSEVKGD